jgi:hypothetical protein
MWGRFNTLSSNAAVFRMDVPRIEEELAVEANVQHFCQVEVPFYVDEIPTTCQRQCRWSNENTCAVTPVTRLACPAANASQPDER